MTSNRTLLMYHELELPSRSFCNSEKGYSRYILKEKDFFQQISYLHQQGFLGLNVSECLKFSNDNDKQVVITFDDGCETDLITAAPILKEYNFNATFYVVAGFLGNPGYLSHSQLRELSDSGFEIGSHSMTHRYLSDLSKEELYFEISQSKTHLEQIIGKNIDHLSCPGGRWTKTAAQIAEQSGYTSMATSQIGTINSKSSLFSLARIPIMRHTGMESFEHICQGKGITLRQARETIFSVAKNVLGNSLYEKVRSKLLNNSTQ
jgi:peptidoglycan/xylan/chitin deacetylase (PgdA/CDA1 family)